MCGDVIVFPEYLDLKDEIKKLQTEISMLLLERDELKYVKCKNIEMQYMLKLGALEHQAVKLSYKLRRLKRMAELITARKNRQEKIVITDIELTLDAEFAEFQKKIDEQIDKMNSALERSKRETLSDEESKELKKLYREIVKSMHPDINPNATESEIQLFQNAVEAYENGDLDTIRIIHQMTEKPVEPTYSDDGLSRMLKEKERLFKTLESVKKQISKIKNSYPYNLLPIVQSEDKIEKKKVELEETITAFEEMTEVYKRRIDEMLSEENL